MSPLLKKLNVKAATDIVILNAPAPLQATLQADFAPYLTVKTNAGDSIDVVLIFCTELTEVAHFSTAIIPKLTNNALLWFCYPKGTSKKYKCNFNRDNGWQALGELGFEPVRMIAIDEDWSALRFKPAEAIKTMTRSFAMTTVGKAKVAKQLKTKAGNDSAQ
jgi:hypothetical protein